MRDELLERRWRAIRATALASLAGGKGDAEDAFTLAQIVRRTFGDVGQLTWDALGIEVHLRRFSGSGVLISSEWPIKIVVRAQDDVRRQRFTIAHELGHYLLRGSEDRIAGPALEQFCDVFASELLVPQSRLDALRSADGELPVAEELVDLANRLRVNFAPIILKIPYMSTARPGFALVAIPAHEGGQLEVERSAGTGGIGGPPEGRTLSAIGSWGLDIDDSAEVRMAGVDRIDTRFVLSVPLPQQDALEAVWKDVRSGAVTGSARWTAFRLRNGRVLLVASLVHVDNLTYSNPTQPRDAGRL